MNITRTALYLLCFFSQCLCAQQLSEKYQFTSIQQNVSQRAISAITQDQDGYLWLGTNGDGLNRYSGLNFKNYSSNWNDNTTLNSSQIYSVFVDSFGQVWVGTEEGLNLYRRDLDQFERIPLTASKTKTPVHALQETEDHQLIVGTHEKGLFVVDLKNKKTKKIKCETALTSLLINTILKTPRGSILIGTNKGLLTYKTGSTTFDYAFFDTLQGQQTIRNAIESLHVFASKIWLGTTSDGLLEIGSSPTNHYRIKNHKLTTKRILAMTQTQEGLLLCGTENDGLFAVKASGEIQHTYRYDPSEKYGLQSNSIWSLYTDYQHRIWVGYYNNGLAVIDKNLSKFNKIESIPNQVNSLNAASVTGIVKDSKKRYWITTIEGGVDVYDPKVQTFTHLNDPKNNIAKGLQSFDIQTIFKDSKENIWLGTWNSGIYFLKKNSTNFQHLHKENSDLSANSVLSFDEDASGKIWIGTFIGGVCSYDPVSKKITHHNSETFKKHHLNTANVRIVRVDHNGHVFVGTRKGLFKIKTKKRNTFEVKSFNKQIQDLEKPQKETMSILSIFEDSQQRLWIGTDGYGLCAYDAVTKKARWYNTSNELIHTTIASLIESEAGELWIGGNKGLSSFDPKTKKVTNFFTKDGLLSNNFNFNAVYKDPNGSLFFGNYKGVNYFNPKKIKYNKEVPKVYITGLKLFNKPVLPGQKDSPLTKVIATTKTLTLNHKQSVFTFDFIGINFSHTAQNKYAYFLEGFEEDWNYVQTNTSATYTNIPPGDYVFHVKAANNDGVWNENATRLTVQIIAPWWKTYWAFAGYLLFISIVGYFIWVFVNERIKEKRIIINQREERKQIEILNAKKIQFFTNISHEFRTPLTLILNPIEDILDDTALVLTDAVKEKHNSIYKNTKRLSRLIDELMDFRKLQFGKMPLQPVKIDPLAFASGIASYFEEEAAQRNIILSIENEGENNSIWADPSMLEKIIFNILSNAFKATPENGMVRLSVHRSVTPVILPLIDAKKAVPAIEININDTGSGIKKENIDKIFERFFQAKEMDKQYYGGTGIGLEVVRSFMELHKGKIRVASKEREGTQFTLYFALGNKHLSEYELKKSNLEVPQNKPLEESVSEEKLKANKHNYKIEESQNNTLKKTVLIVEDNAELRSYIKKELAAVYKVIVAENGKEGIEKANKTIPDLIITDVMMPLVDGYELCEKIKSNLKTSHIPLLMLTAKGMEVDRIKGIDAGADVYLKKPFNMRVLRSHTKQLITSRQLLFTKYFTGIQQKELPKQTTSLDKQFITKVLDYIHKNMEDPKLNVENLAEELLLSRSKLYRKIKALTGDTANEFLRKIRLEKAKTMIETSEDTISEICYKVGFSSPSYFTKCFKKHFGILPTEIRPEKNR